MTAPQTRRHPHLRPRLEHGDRSIRAAEDPAYPAEIVTVVAEQAGRAGLGARQGARHRGGAARSHEVPLAHELRAEAQRHPARAQDRPRLQCRVHAAADGRVRQPLDRPASQHPPLAAAGLSGLDTHQRVLDSGAWITGATVHFVRVEMDAGPIIAQAAVPVAPGDTAETLAERVLAAEHRLYPHALELVASGAAYVIDGRVLYTTPGVPLARRHDLAAAAQGVSG